MVINGKYIPSGWQELAWSDFVKVSEIKEFDQLLMTLCKIDEGQLNTLTQDQLWVAYGRLTFLNQHPLPAVLDKPIDLHSLESYISARNIIKTQPTDWLNICRCFWPDIQPNADAVISHYYAIKAGFDQLDKDFAMLNEPASQDWIKAGVQQLSAFGDYSMVHQLAGGDILKEDAILQLPIRQVFMHRAYKIVSAKIEDKYARNMAKKHKLAKSWSN